MMRVNIYYGGRGLIEDPTIYVINKLTEVLTELRVEVTRYNLYEEKHGISALTRTLKECDGVILASTVEWIGIGGLMQQFLDDCWLYADKEHLASVYMLPVVTSVSYGEKDAEYSLIKAWDMLGGISCHGISAYVKDYIEFETNPEYGFLIEKEAESLYRAISQKRSTFPCSTHAVKKNVLRKNTLDLTPQESEQLSVYASNDTYVKKQKEDIEELAQLFKEMLGDVGEKTEETQPVKAESPAPAQASVQSGARIQPFIPPVVKDRILTQMQSRFQKGHGINASFVIKFTDSPKSLVVDIKEDMLNCYYGEKEDADVNARTTMAVFDSMLAGEMSMQRAFMTGVLTARGNFKTLRSFDTAFNLV